MPPRRWNWLIWIGFVICLVAFFSYPLLIRFPALRDYPWVNLVLFAAGILIALSGWRRAYQQPGQLRGKIAGPILSVLGLTLLVLFCFGVFYFTRQLPASLGAPHVGQKMPDFMLRDSDNNSLSLAELLGKPASNSQHAAKGVLLVFYRGYW
jgi:hypothetical protein